MDGILMNKNTFMIKKNRILENFEKFSNIGSVYYPLKTNSNVKILEILKPYIDNTNNGFLISYLSHYKVLEALNINPRNICLMNVLSSLDNIKLLYDKGIRFFTFDNLDLIKKMDNLISFKNLKVNIRLSTTEVFPKTFSHLGANTKECIEIVDYLNSRGCNIGISFYINNEIKKNKNSLRKMIKYIVENFKDRNISFISMGGVECPDKIDVKAIDYIKKKLNLNEVILEPGQYLVGDAVDLETSIIRTKIIKDKVVVILNNGIYSGLFDALLYKKHFKMYIKDIDGKKIQFSPSKTSESDMEIFLYGGSSDSGDKLGTIFINNKYTNRLIANTKVYIENVGAYFEEFFMAYGNDIERKYLILEE